MPRRIDEDHKEFHDVYGGRKRKELKKYIKNGSIFRKRGKDGKIIVTIPKIEIPHIVYGNNKEGVGRGQGEEGDVIGKDDGGDKGKGGAGQGQGDGIDISVDLEEVLEFLQDELELPNLEPKPNETYEDVEIKYNDISMNGPESLRHNRKTMIQAMKRQCSDGSINKLHKIPGFATPVRLITPQNADKRYRQWKEVKIPSSNAVIFFARDGSASMDQTKCDIVSDVCWWLDIWIRRFYKRVERCYVWHDTIAQEVDENKFYKHRYGGGTVCSSALKLIAKQFENRFPPNKWNIYVFYFSDGDNWPGDNELFVKTLKENFGPNAVNLFGLTQVLSWNKNNSLRSFVDDTDFLKGAKNIRTTGIEKEGEGGWGSTLDSELADELKRKAIIDLIGKKAKV